MTSSLRIPIILSNLSCFSTEPNSSRIQRRTRRKKIGFLLRGNGCSSINCSTERWSFVEVGIDKDGILMAEKGKGKGRRESLVVVRANQGFGGGGGGGGGWDQGSTSRVLGNLALAAGLTYLSVTGQLGWILDAIVSIWLLAVLLPIVGLGIFFWYAGRDIVQSSCPNCGNDFQILKSSLNDGVQLCPFCTQPFSVQGNKFVREPTKFSSGRSKASQEAFNSFSSFSEKGKPPGTKVLASILFSNVHLLSACCISLPDRVNIQVSCSL